MTLEDAWDVLEAAEQVAQAHGYRCSPVITREALLIGMRGRDHRTAVIPTAELEACADVAARRELVEREVALLLRRRTGARA